MHKNLTKFFLLILTSSLLLTGCRDKCNSEPNLDVDQTQLAADIAIIDAYLEENDIEAETHPSGIRYVIKRSGDGDRPKLCDDVVVTYEGKLISNGNAFDSRTSPANLGELRDLITGWQIGIPLIKEDGRISLYIPSVYAYGENGQPTNNIPSNANLQFEVLLFQVR